MTRNRRPRLGLIIATLLAINSLWVLCAHAQSSAAIVGSVRDDSGGTVAGAHIVLVVPATGARRDAVSDQGGGFEIAGLLPAQRLDLEVVADGFATARRVLVPLTSGEHRLVDVRLEVAGVAERLEVVSDGTLTRTTSPELGGHIGVEQLERLPLNGRDLLSVAYLVPGAAPARGFYNLAPRLTINGASSLATNYNIDGLDNTDLFLGGPKIPVTVGSADDVKVMVNAYAPEYGRTGNGVFSVTTRSGASRHTGDLFYMLRPGAVVDAPNYFAPRDASGAVIDDNFIRHQGGGSVGGPAMRDRLFYFGDIEVTRERQDAILTSPLSPGLWPTAFRGQTWMGKADLRWSNAQISTFRYHGSDYTHDGDVGFIGGLTLPSAGLQVNYRNQFASFTHRSVGRVGLNELDVQGGQLRSDWRPLDAGPRIVVTDRGSQLATIGAASDNFFWTETDAQVRDVYTQRVGRHSLKAGVDLLHAGFTVLSAPGARGTYIVDLEGRPITPSGSLLEEQDIPRDVAVLSYSQSFVNPAVHEPQTLAAAFAEDSFRATVDLTLTLGVRWDYDSVTSTPLTNGDTNNLAPRFGASWAPRGSTRHQLRGGYGIFYERIPFAVYSDTIFNRPDGGAVSVTFAPGTPFDPPMFPNTLPPTAFDDLPLSQLPPRNVQVFDPGLRSPFTEQASAGYVLTPAGDLAVAIDYVHSRGRNLIRRIDTNSPVSIPAGTMRPTADADLTRSIVPAAGGFRLIEMDTSSGHSTFDGLYLTVRRRLTRGVAFDVAYTLSRLDNDTDDINFRPVDSRHPDDEFGPSLNDRRHVLAINGLVRLNGLVDVVPVWFVSSGQPLNVTTGTDDNGDTIFNDRPAGVARNSERTSGFNQFDLSLIKEIQLRRARLQLRADIFNLFNRTNFSGFFNYGASGVRPDENGTLAFQPTAAGPARQMQFGARLRF